MLAIVEEKGDHESCSAMEEDSAGFSDESSFFDGQECNIKPRVTQQMSHETNTTV